MIGTAAFGTVYLALVHHPSQAVRGFAVVCLALAAMAGLAVRSRGA